MGGSENHEQQKKQLSACQRQGPALGAKKAFEHKKRKYGREQMEGEGVNPEDKRVECEHCGRRFNHEIFERHFIICEKVFIKRRKIFNSLYQRVLNEDHLKAIELAQTKFSYYNENQKLNTKWKIRRAHFLVAVKHD